MEYLKLPDEIFESKLTMQSVYAALDKRKIPMHDAIIFISCPKLDTEKINPATAIDFFICGDPQTLALALSEVFKQHIPFRSLVVAALAIAMPDHVSIQKTEQGMSAQPEK